MLLVVLCLVCSVSRSSVDYESLFFEDVHVEQLVDYDGGHEFLEVSSSGLPQHRHEGNFEQDAKQERAGARVVTITRRWER